LSTTQQEKCRAILEEGVHTRKEWKKLHRRGIEESATQCFKKKDTEISLHTAFKKELGRKISRRATENVHAGRKDVGPKGGYFLRRNMQGKKEGGQKKEDRGNPGKVSAPCRL